MRAPAWSAAAILFLGFFILEPRAIPRPHLVSFAGMAVCTWLIERTAAARSLAPLVWAIPVVALWSNLHVECVFGVVLIGIFASAELIRPAALTRRGAARAVLIAAGCAAATAANPYGWGLAAYLYENISVPQILAIAELRPPYLPDVPRVLRVSDRRRPAARRGNGARCACGKRSPPSALPFSASATCG